MQNTRKGEHLEFTELEPWPGGKLIQFAGRYLQKNGKEKKVAVCIGPEYDTVTRTLLIDAAREAADMFDMLVVLGFAFEAHADESMASLGNLSVWRVRMNNDLHMGERLASKKIDGSNLFVSLGEPDITLHRLPDDMMKVEILGIDIFNPATGELTANDVGDIACWMIDTDYDGKSFFVRHAYFCGDGKDPYKQLKKALKAEISEELWDTLRASVSRPFAKPKTGKIAVKAINHHGDEVMKVFSIN